MPDDSFCSRDLLLYVDLGSVLRKQPSFTGHYYQPLPEQPAAAGVAARGSRAGVFVTACIYAAVDGAATQSSQGTWFGSI